jgi:hypothetical protein
MIKLHDNLGSRRACACIEAGIRSQNGDRASGCTTEEHRSVVLFLWAKGLNANDIHKEMVSVYRRKSFSCKEVLNWAEKFFQARSKVTDDVR